MRKSVTLKYLRNGDVVMTAGPNDDHDKQRSEFNKLPSTNSVDNEVEKVQLVMLSRENVKARTFIAGESKPKAAKKKAATKD